MTTVSDPLGTPVPSYNRSGTTIIGLVGGTHGAPTPIPLVSGTTVVIVAPDMSNNNTVELPTGADVGDVVEVYPETQGSGGKAFYVVPPSGETIGGGAVSGESGLYGIVLRKISSTDWRGIMSAAE